MLPLVDILFALFKAIPNIFENLAIHYQNLKTWTDHKVTRYPILKALPHTLPYIFLKEFPGFGQYATGYHALQSILSKIYILFFKKKLTETRSNALQISKNHSNSRENVS